MVVYTESGPKTNRPTSTTLCRVGWSGEIVNSISPRISSGPQRGSSSFASSPSSPTSSSPFSPREPSVSSPSLYLNRVGIHPLLFFVPSHFLQSPPPLPRLLLLFLHSARRPPFILCAIHSSSQSQEKKRRKEQNNHILRTLQQNMPPESLEGNENKNLEC